MLYFLKIRICDLTWTETTERNDTWQRMLSSINQINPLTPLKKMANEMIPGTFIPSLHQVVGHDVTTSYTWPIIINRTSHSTTVQWARCRSTIHACGDNQIPPLHNRYVCCILIREDCGFQEGCCAVLYWMYKSVLSISVPCHPPYLPWLDAFYVSSSLLCCTLIVYRFLFKGKRAQKCWGSQDKD